MTWGEAVRLTRTLRADPGSQIAAAVEGWEYPFPRDVALIADLWDLEHAKAGAKRAATYPRPWAVKADGRRHGKPRPYAEVAAILNEYGHALPV